MGAMQLKQMKSNFQPTKRDGRENGQLCSQPLAVGPVCFQKSIYKSMYESIHPAVRFTCSLCLFITVGGD